MSDEFSEYKDIFLSEMEEVIYLMNSTLIEVEKNPTEQSHQQEVIRAAHTIKGAAATMGYTKLTTFTHGIEDYLGKLDKISPGLIQTLFKATDLLQKYYDVIKADGDPESIDPTSILRELTAGGLEVREDLMVSTGTTYNLEIKFDPSARLIGARGFQIYRVIDGMCKINTSDPPIQVLEDGKLLGDINMEVLSYESELELRNAILSVGDVKSVSVSRLMDEGADIKPAARRVTTRESTQSIQSVRVNLDKLDKVVDLLGELVITKGRFQSLVPALSTEILEQFQLFDNTINTIQDTVMGLRMVPLSRIFETYPRTVRDIAHSRSIEIELLLQGSHHQIDRSVVDQVNEALLHLIRNAAIHGIEEKNIRKSAGKPSKGTIRLAARRERGEIVFEVEDDGGGIDVDKIRARAIASNLISADTPFTRSQVASLIFHPGFSTAETLTDVAGRGVGMGIVKQTIDEISGNIVIRTKKGVGTRFIIRVPQTLAIVDALIVETQGQLFSIPLLNIEKVFSVNDPSVIDMEDGKYLYWEGYNVRIVDLGKIIMGAPKLNEVKEEEAPTRKRRMKIISRAKVILWERAGRRIGILVDNVIEQREIVTKQLDEVYSGIVKGFSGATILGYDMVALIVDPDQIEAEIENR